MPDHDSFARTSAARAWAEARDARRDIEAILDRLSAFEKKGRSLHYQRCQWCGEWSLAPACREHFDLMSPADLLEEVLGA